MEAIMSEPLPEAALMDDLAATADLKAKVAQAWQEFASGLSGALSGLVAGTHFDLALDPTATGTGDAVYGVTVEVVEDDRLLALAVGNGSLPEGYRLDRHQVAALVALGWAPPGVVPGSGDEFGLLAPTADAARTAVTVARTLRDVYGAPHPAFVTYVARDPHDKPVEIPTLGTARPLIVSGEDKAVDLSRLDKDEELSLAERVTAVVAGLLKTTPDALQVDSDGDIGIRSGSAMVFVRVRDNPPLVDVFSPVLTEVEMSEKLYVRLSELTNRMPIGRLYCTTDTVWASVPVFGRDFQATHLMLAVQVMTGLADELDDRLQGEFGGRRFFGEGDKPALKGGDHRTGMYL
jgi:T3SS (YopN, CesT) and YbjN peptide-binding chaperone 1/T3SS (YopN, CesT) and YbjN peptide-binding chaperone 3